MGDWLEILTVYVGENTALLLFPVGLFLLSYGLYHYKMKLPAGASFEKDTQEAQKQRKEYVTWRRHFKQKGWMPGQVYSAALEKFLGILDRFFGTSDDHKSTFLRFWGPKSLDRCFAIALVYPLITLFGVWVATGYVGPVEATLGLPEGRSLWVRLGIFLFFIYYAATIVWLFKPPAIHQTFKWFMIRLGAVAVAVAVAVAGAGAGAGAVVVAVAGAVALAGAVAVAVGVAGAVGVGGAVTVAGAVAVAVAGAGAVAVAGAVAIEFAEKKSLKSHLSGLIGLLVLYIGLMPIVVWQLPVRLSTENPNWIFLIFFGVLPLMNAFFDWISIGMTRYLLRKGQTHPRSVMPVVYAGLDLLFATFMMFVLLILCLAYLGLLNHFAVLGSGQPALDLGVIMGELRAENPGPSVWWIYVTIFTTFLPSFINLILGCLSFIRGIPGLWTWVLDRHLPEDPANLTRLNRLWASAVLTFQLAIAVAAAAILGWLVLDGVLSFLALIGANMLDIAQALIDLIG